jgi:hypothetical protein
VAHQFVADHSCVRCLQIVAHTLATLPHLPTVRNASLQQLRHVVHELRAAESNAEDLVWPSTIANNSLSAAATNIHADCWRNRRHC